MWAAALASGALAISSCSSSAGGQHSTVSVLYAGSLVALMQQQIGPGFRSATGYDVTGYSSGSTALATQIKGKVRAADVFISANPDVDATLQGASNGDWVSWYATYATSPLVLGYNAESPFAAQLRSKPWYQVLTEPGLRVGLTDPATDPKGKLAVRALTETARSRGLPSLAALASASSAVFPEETLVGRLQSGQLDAGFFYRSEAVAAGIPTVRLTGVNLSASYTVTILNHAPHEKAAEAFVNYLLGAKGRAVLAADGFTVANPPAVTGSGVPRALHRVLAGS